MSGTDHAPAIAAFLVERADTPGYQGDPDPFRTIAARWPDADEHETRRGLLIAHELIEVELGELRAMMPAPRPEPTPERLAAMVAGVAAILAECRSSEDFGEAMLRVGAT